MRRPFVGLLNCGIKKRRARGLRRRAFVEALEQRIVLNGTSLSEYSRVHSSWFDEIQPATLSGQFSTQFAGALPPDATGQPRSWEVEQWIVRLSPEAVAQSNVSATSAVFDGVHSLRVVRGLGLPGQLLVEAPQVDHDAIAASLANHPSVVAYEPDQIVEAALMPDDPEFIAGRMVGLKNTGEFGAVEGADISAEDAWDASTGSPSVVVGVIDSGVDATHPDLYLNIWLNQGEIRSALNDLLTDVDGDGLITFYDLNNCVNGDPNQCNAESGANAALVNDLNGNGYIDALDLLNDPAWADGRDTDQNGFIDDFFGWNFRASEEALAANVPTDTLGHGTHVAGTIAAIGNNGVGVTGINWRSSIMALKFLDNNNRGRTSDAVLAVNYATMMRRDHGVDIPVLNNSWGQTGTFSVNLEAAIRTAGEEQILFVAAAGNGNILGNGVDNDITPFYPASYELENVIAVASSDPNDELARFSNFGKKSVDIAAPGVGIVSTLPGERYGSTNGTSMATPHVSGTVALIRSVHPQASVNETRIALLGTADVVSGLQGQLASGGRLNAASAIDADVFTPSAALVSVDDVTASGAAVHEIVIRYEDRSGIDQSTIGDGDILITPQRGPRDPISTTLKPGSVVVEEGGTRITATYQMTPPGGAWDPLDFGRYVISTAAGQIRAAQSQLSIRAINLGEFDVRVDDPGFIYVDATRDALGIGSLRDAIIAANAAAPEPRTILLSAGTYRLRLARQADPASSFPFPGVASGCTSVAHETMWSGETTGDLDVTGSVTIIGDHANLTRIDAAGIDRVFKVHPAAALSLQNLSITGGVSPPDQGGGGILSAGELSLQSVIVSGNRAVGDLEAIGGGGIAAWGGTITVDQSRITRNQAGGGGGIFVCNAAQAMVVRSTLDTNLATLWGGGLGAVAAGQINVENTTVSGNIGGAINHETRANLLGLFPGDSGFASISDDGRFVAFHSRSDNLTPGDFPGALDGDTDVFVYDRVANVYEEISLANGSIQATGFSGYPSISGDGRFVAFESVASSLVPGDTNLLTDIFVADRLTGQVERVSVSDNGDEANGLSGSTVGSLAGGEPAISGNGRFVAFGSAATNLVPNDTNDASDIFVFDRDQRVIERVSVTSDGAQAELFSESTAPSISEDGRYVAFVTNAALVAEDTNFADDVYVFDRELDTVERVSIADDGSQGNGFGAFGSGTSISGDGRYVAFSSFSTNLVPNDLNARPDVFVYDRDNDTIERVSVASDGTEANDSSGTLFGADAAAAISRDGRFVTFGSAATNLVPDDNNGQTDAFRHDRQTGETTRISENAAGIGGLAAAESSAISGDGQIVAFTSAANNLAIRDSDGAMDVFVSDLTGAVEVSNISDASPDGDTVGVKHATLAFNVGENVVSGPSEVGNSLFALNQRTAEVSNGAVSLGGNLFSSSNDTLQLTDVVFGQVRSTLEDLQIVEGIAPVHPLILGNPAIDAGIDLGAASEQDQLLRPRNAPDIGAAEAVDAKIIGTVFVDQNLDALAGASEPVLPDVVLYLDENGDQVRNPGEPSSLTAAENGEYLITGVSDPNPVLRFELPDGFSRVRTPIERTSIGNGGVEGVTPLQTGLIGVTSNSISGDGRFVAFAAPFNNLTDDDDDAIFDVFVRDRLLGTTERIALTVGGLEIGASTGSPSISADGRYLAIEAEDFNLQTFEFETDIYLYDRLLATTELISDGGYAPTISGDGSKIGFLTDADLIPEDVNGRRDVYVYDRNTGTTELVSVATDGTQGDFHSGIRFSDGGGGPALSFDGTLIAFSSASVLHPDDTNDLWDIYLRDIENDTTELVSFNDQFIFGGFGSFAPDVSDDGNLIVFSSDNLYDFDFNNNYDIFVYDRTTTRITRVSVAADGSDGNSISDYPSISGDGRYVAFESAADNLVPDDSNGVRDVFVVDLARGAIDRITQGIAGIPASGSRGSEFVEISRDGSQISFTSDQENLIANDFNRVSDTFAAFNQLQRTSPTRDLVPGEIRRVDIGLIANPGSISGTVFEDLNGDGILQKPGGGFAEADRPLANVQVYIDRNRNQVRDFDEPTVVTNAGGEYRFENVESFRNYQIRLEVPAELQQLVPGALTQFAQQFFLQAEGNETSRDFALIVTSAGGQSQESRIDGVVFQDTNQDGFQQAGEPGLGGAKVFLDRNRDGIRQNDEEITTTLHDDPATPSDEAGRYSFEDLGAEELNVTLVAIGGMRQTSPRGNVFASQTRSFKSSISQSNSLRDVVTADFNQDGFLDLAVAYFHENANLSILLNDTAGSFESTAIDIKLDIAIARAEGATALAAGDFNGSGSMDLAVVNNLSGTVTILQDFNGSGFELREDVAVGLAPSSVAAVDADGDGDLDLFVVNSVGGSVSLLANDGSGGFTNDGTPLSISPCGPPAARCNLLLDIATGDFNGDGGIDFAVANNDTGKVAVVLHQGNGTYNSPVTYQVLGKPSNLVSADFNGDGHLDLVAASLESKTLTMLLGASDGTFAASLDAGNLVSAGEAPTDIEAIDIDGDGDMDLAVTDQGGQEVFVYRNLLNQRGFGFEPRESIGAFRFVLLGKLSLASGDFDKSGTMDLAVGNSVTDSIDILSNTLTAGPHRLELDGVASVEGLNFGVASLNLTASTSEDDSIEVSLAAHDPVMGTLTYSLPGSNETLSILGGVVRFDPSKDLTLQRLRLGEAAVRLVNYEVTNPGGLKATATLAITVHGVNDWHNQARPLDIDQDGAVAPRDALIVINTLNELGSRSLEGVVGFGQFLYDADNDNHVSPVDALLVINFLNLPLAAGEAEGVPPLAVNAISPVPTASETPTRAVSRSSSRDLATSETLRFAKVDMAVGSNMQPPPMADSRPCPLTELSDEDWDELLTPPLDESVLEAAP